MRFQTPPLSLEALEERGERALTEMREIVRDISAYARLARQNNSMLVRGARRRVLLDPVRKSTY